MVPAAITTGCFASSTPKLEAESPLLVVLCGASSRSGRSSQTPSDGSHHEHDDPTISAPNCCQPHAYLGCRSIRSKMFVDFH
jgi:hypothetical protein